MNYITDIQNPIIGNNDLEKLVKSFIKEKERIILQYELFSEINNSCKSITESNKLLISKFKLLVSL